MNGIGTPDDGLAFTQLPLGLGMALAMNEPAMSRYAGLTETEKEHLILRCKDARSKAEMQRIVDSLAKYGDVDELLSGDASGRDSMF